MLRYWFSSLAPTRSATRLRKRRVIPEPRPAMEALEDRVAPGEMAFATFGMFVLPGALGPTGVTATPPLDANDSKRDFPGDLSTHTIETSPPEYNPGWSAGVKHAAQHQQHSTTPPNYDDTPSDLLESIFADDGLQSALLTPPPTTSEPPHPKPIDLPELPQPHKPSGGGGATGLDLAGGSGGGGVSSAFAGVWGKSTAGTNSPQMVTSSTGGIGTARLNGGDPLVANDDSITATEDYSRTFNPLVNDTGGAAGPFIIDVSSPAHGTAWFTPYGITFNPEKDFDESVSFDYTITDGHGQTSTASVTITVTPDDDVPRLDRVPYHTIEGGSVTIDLLAHVEDPEGAVTLVSVDASSEHGGTVVDNGDGTVTYSPYYQDQDDFPFPILEGGFNGDWDRFQYTITDGTGNQRDIWKRVYVVSSDSDYNDPLLLDYGAFGNSMMTEGGSAQINLFTNAFDDESPLTLLNISDWNWQGLDYPNMDVQFDSSGSVTMQAAGNFIKGHQPQSFGFHFLIEDSDEDFYGAGAGFTAKVLPINEPPVANIDVVYAAPGSTITIRPLHNDTDFENDQVFLTNVSGGAFGTTTFTPDTVSLTVDPDATSGGSIQYTIKDGYGGVTTGSVVVNLVQVTGYKIERQKDDGSWVEEDGQLWTADTLRWKAELSNEPPLPVERVEWTAAPWLLKDDPAAYDEFTEIAGSLDWATGNLGWGIWAIKPVVTFAGNGAQAGFTATMADPPQEVIAEILGVSWVGVDPGDGNTNLANDNPQNMGDGWRIFPDANEFGGSAHNEVMFQVTVAPYKTGIVVPVKLFDADDPTPVDGEDVNAAGDAEYHDNFGNAPNFPDSVITEDAGLLVIGKETFSVAANPGDNYRVVAAPREENFDDLRPLAPDATGRLYLDTSEDRNYDNNEPILDESSSVGGMHASPLLTVWRRLNVEVDSWGAPPAGVVYNPNDDPAAGDIADPDISALGGAFAEAFIQVVQFQNTAEQTYNESGLAWELQDNPQYLNQPGFDTMGEIVDYAETHRQSQESEWFWSSYVLGIYEFGNTTLEGKPNATTLTDNDVDSEPALMGYNVLGEPEVALIPMEILRDVAAQHNISMADLNRFVTVHEIGHQFELTHNYDLPRHVMTTHQSDAEEAAIPTWAIKFSEADLKEIREEIPDDPNQGP